VRHSLTQLSAPLYEASKLINALASLCGFARR